jgi:hypothetical protein
MSNKYIFLIALTLVIHFIDTLSYSVRLNSVKSGNFALSTSLFNIIVLVSRTANTFQGPLIGSLIDSSISNKYDPLMQVRGIILAASGGTLVAIFLIPTFLKLFEIAMAKLEVSGSIPSLVVQSLSVSNIKRIAKSTIKPKKSMLDNLRYKNIPKRLLLLNAFITGVYTIGVLSSNYAVIYLPNKAATIAQSSGLINGIATIMLTLFIDPKSAVITDEAYRGKREYSDVKALVIMLIGTKLIGTLLGQLLLVPSARLLSLIYK